MMALQRTSGCWTLSIQVVAVGCCRWTDTCNWYLRVCCSSQSWILMFISVNLHLMTLHKTTWIGCSNSCPKLANSGGLSEAFIAPRLVSLLLRDSFLCWPHRCCNQPGSVHW